MVDLYECMVWGDLGSDRTSEQYPMVKVCGDCVEKAASAEGTTIVSVGDHAVRGNEEDCHFSANH